MNLDVPLIDILPKLSMAASSSAAPQPNIGILSIGDMGMGVASLLKAHDYMVYTVGAGRSQSTLDRIKKAEIITLPSDEALVVETDIILSIVPPRDAVATARRIVEACRSSDAIKKRMERKDTVATGQAPSLLYIDLNAISSKTAKLIAHTLHVSTEPSTKTPSRTRSRSTSFPFLNSEPEIPPIPLPSLDGGIIGGPPSLQDDGNWKKPSICISGPKLTHHLSASLISVLNIKNLGEKIGPASALKSCFASLSKGFTALSILSYTTAHSAGVLKELQEELEGFNPDMKRIAEAGLTRMPPKAYRWVEEMRQIGETFAEEGGFGAGLGGQDMFNGVADVYDVVTRDTALGLEKSESRKRGKTAEDVAVCMTDGIRKRRKKETGGEEELKMQWKGSWS